MKRYIYLLFALLTTINVSSITPSILHHCDTSARDKWVDSVYNTLTPRQRIGQLFVPVVYFSQDKNYKTTINRLVKEYHIGGLLFGHGSVDRYASTINYAQSIAKVPLMITFDGEWGLSMRMKNTPRYPHNMGLGAIDDEKLLYDYGRRVAEECRTLGIHVNFAPVLDVNSNPANPVIGYRSFGEDPQKVSRLAIAYSQGLEDGGVLSVGKHFPGHGDTSTDSHKELPTVTHDIARLDTTDLVPFREYINAGLSGVMVGHLNVPSLDNSGTPASLSKKITTNLLRNKMNFEGLIFTDALEMKGAKVPGVNNCVQAFIAGADMLLASASPVNDIIAFEKAVNSGKISKAEVERRCRKILAYKYVLNLPEEKNINITGLSQKINSEEAEDINRRLSAALMTVIFNKKTLLPINDLANKSIAVVSIGADKNNVFAQYCRKYANVKTFFTKSTAFTEATLANIKKHDIIIVGVFTDKAWARNVYAQFDNTDGLIPVFFMNPYRMNKFSSSLRNEPTLVLAYDDTPYIREYAAQAIFGGIDVTGKLPVNLKHIAPMGTGVMLKKTRIGYSSPTSEGFSNKLSTRIDSIIKVGLRTKAFPGCQILVAKNGNVVIDKSYGILDFISEQKVSDETLYDLASVSKATGTLPGVMLAYDKGLFSLDDFASKHIPGLQGTDKDSITIKQLLYHESGMPASLNMFNLMMDSTSYDGKLITRRRDAIHTIKIENRAYGHKDAKLRRDITSATPSSKYNIEAAKGLYVSQETFDTIMANIYNAKLRPTNKYNYSCLNFCLLMDLEQRLTDTPHNKWVEENIYAPLGAYHTTYRPLSKWKLNDIAPTENDTYLRRQTVHGYVHDETANFSGGIQGNAGLFSNANDLAKLCQMWLNKGKYGGLQIFSPETVKLFTTSKSPTCRRGLGFDKPDMENPDNSPTTKLATASTYGHLGFTGTVFWVDPENELIFIFLCNRVVPTRNNKAFNELNIRPALFEMVYQEMRK